MKTILVLNNKELNQENVDRTKNQALNFLINFKLKKEEIIKYKIKANDEVISNHLNNIASNYNTDEEGLKTIFKNNGINYELFLDGIKTEFGWQQLIFNFYQDKIIVNEKEIDEELNEIVTQQKKAEEYNLAEIEIILGSNADNEKKIKEIKDQINKNGFKNTAIKYSSSLTALEGGSLGWIASQALSNIILERVKQIKPGIYLNQYFNQKQQHLLNYYIKEK